MNNPKAFQAAFHEAIRAIDPDVFAYDESEFWMIRAPYDYLEFYAYEHRLLNMAVALRLVRGLHNGVHRKSSIQKDGVSYRLPYVIHCLMVCRMLADLHLPLPHDELDVVLAAALCHDCIEDIPFENHGRELTEVFHLDPRVYETVQLVSKRKDFTPEEEQAHFDGIAQNRLAILVKLSDRGHNVEDLYNMKVWKVHEYVGETRKYFVPMWKYGLKHYPELRKSIAILKDKIVSLTLASETMVDQCEAREAALKEHIAQLQAENERLRSEYRQLMDG